MPRLKGHGTVLSLYIQRAYQSARCSAGALHTLAPPSLLGQAEIWVGKVEELQTDSPHPDLGPAGVLSAAAKPILSDL